MNQVGLGRILSIATAAAFMLAAAFGCTQSKDPAHPKATSGGRVTTWTVTGDSTVQIKGGESYKGAKVIGLQEMREISPAPERPTDISGPALFVEPSDPEIGLLNLTMEGQPGRRLPREQIRAGASFRVKSTSGQVYVIDIISYTPGDRPNAKLTLRIRSEPSAGRQGSTRRRRSLSRQLRRANRECRAGSVDSCYLLGKYAQDRRSFAMAKKYYERACLGRHWKACSILARLHHGNRLTEKYLRFACANGFVKGCVQLGYHYSNCGRYPPQSRQEEWAFKQACNGEYWPGCTALGSLYEGRESRQGGAGAPYARALRFYKMACEKGEGRGCAGAARIYEERLGKAALALQYWRKACKTESGLCHNVERLERR